MYNVTNDALWMPPALCPDPFPHNNLSKPTLSMGTECSKDTVFNLQPHTQPLISKLHICSRESWPGGVFISATRWSYLQPSVLLALFSSWASLGLHVTLIQASLAGIQWVPHVKPMYSTGDSQLCLPPAVIFSLPLSLSLLLFFFIDVIFGFTALYLHILQVHQFF